MQELPPPSAETRVPESEVIQQLPVDSTDNSLNGLRQDTNQPADAMLDGGEHQENKKSIPFRIGKFIGRRIIRNEVVIGQNYEDVGSVEETPHVYEKPIKITPLEAELGYAEREGLADTSGIEPAVLEDVNKFFEESLKIGLPSKDIIRNHGNLRMWRRLGRGLQVTFNPDGTARDIPKPTQEEVERDRKEDEDLHKAFYATLTQYKDRLKANDEAYEVKYEDTLRSDLNYSDVLGDRVVPIDLENVRPSSARYAEVLTKLKLTNPEGLIEASTDIRNRFESLRHLAGVEMSVFANSKTWILWDIAKQEALGYTGGQDYMSRDTTASYSGSVLDRDYNSGKLTQQAEFMRDVVAWRHFGWELHKLAVSNDPRIKELSKRLDPYTRGLLTEPGNPDNNDQLSSAQYTDLGRRLELVLSEQSDNFAVKGLNERRIRLYNNSQPAQLV